MGFELPPGDPDALDSALKKFATVGTDAHGTESDIKSGFAQALSTWHGARADDFRGASAGIQLQVQEADSSIGNAAADLRAYAKILRTNIEEIKHLAQQAAQRNSSVDKMAKKQGADGTSVNMAQQHAATFVAGLEHQAEQCRAAVRRSASATAGLIDAATDMAVPNSTKLSPAEIARRVDTTTGVAGIRSATANGTLTADQAWGALKTASTEVPTDAINADGSIDADKLATDVHNLEKEEAENPGKVALDTTLDYWTLATAPAGAWSVTMLAKASAEFAKAKSALPVDLYKLSQRELDAVPKGPAENPLSVLDEIERGPKFTPADEKAFSTLSNLQKAQESIGGLGKFEAVGRVFDGLAVVGDVWTLADPKSAKDDKIDAGVNLTGLALTTGTGTELAGDALIGSGLIAADASLGWIPVVGWGLVAASAGYEVYKHWDTVTKYTGVAYHATANFVTHTAPQALSDAGHATENFATHTAPHALSSAAHSTGHFITSHIPHVHLW